MLVQEPSGLILRDAFTHGDELSRHQFGDRLFRLGGETHVAVGEDADELARPAVVGSLDDRNAGNGVTLHDREGIGQRLVGEDGDRVHHHAAFVTLHLADLVGLFGWLEIAVDDAETTGLRHRDREPRLGHSVHRGGDDRQVESDAARQARADVHAAREHSRVARLEEDIVEGEGFGKIHKANSAGGLSAPSGNVCDKGLAAALSTDVTAGERVRDDAAVGKCVCCSTPLILRRRRSCRHEGL